MYKESVFRCMSLDQRALIPNKNHNIWSLVLQRSLSLNRGCFCFIKGV